MALLIDSGRCYLTNWMRDERRFGIILFNSNLNSNFMFDAIAPVYFFKTFITVRHRAWFVIIDHKDFPEWLTI